MKRTFLSILLCKGILIFLLASTSLQLTAQTVTNYVFAGTTGTFTALSSPISTTGWTGTTDDGISGLIPVGFDFWYMGIRYDNIAASTNGWLTLGNLPTDNIYTNSLSTAGSPRPVIAPLWDDLDIGTTTNVTYKTTGTAGSRIFTLQYLNVRWYYLAIGSVCSFQIRLYENTGKIEYIYRSDAASAVSPSASIGITAAATGSGSFLSVNNAGTSVSSTIEATVTTKRVTGRTYGFTPPVPTAPGSLTFSGITNTSMTLNWTDLSSNERGFVIYRSTDAINYTFITQTAVASTSSLQSGLTAGTTYYWKIYAVSEGGLSIVLSGSQLLACSGPAISQLPVTGLIANYKFEGNANDAISSNNGTFQGIVPTQAPDRFSNTNKAYLFNGSSNYISTANAYVNPGSFSTSIWFKTTTTVGGVLIGFSSMQTGNGGSRDRFIYMTGTGVLYLGVAPGSVKKYVSTATAYNDGNWHLATSTLGAGGLKLYVDGVLTASDGTVTSAESYTGYWRIGYDDVATWPNEPTSHYFQGTLDDAVIYHRELNAAEVSILYNSPDGAGSNSPVCAGTSLSLTVTTAAGASYSWTGPNGFTSNLQNPALTFSAAHAGIYTVQATMAGCATPAVAYVTVSSTNTTGQWTGNVDTDWANANNWCDGLVPTSTTDVIIAAGTTRMPTISSSVNCRNLSINTGATLTLNLAGTLNITGTLANGGTFTNNGSVSFNGTSGQQTFSGVSTFYNLILNNSSGLLLPAAIIVNNNLSVTVGTLTANNFNITIKRNWTNNSSALAFAAGTSTVTFNGTTAQLISGTFATSFNHLSIVNTANIVTLNTNISLSGNLAVSSGTFDLDVFTANRLTPGGMLTVSNNATLKIGGTNTYPANYTNNTLVVASTVEYSGTSQTVANQPYGNLKLSSSAGAAIKTFPATALSVVGNLSSIVGLGTSVSFTAASVITVSGNVSIAASTTFNGGIYAHNIGGNWLNNGTFNGNTGTIIFTGPGTTVSGSGTQNFNNLTVAAPLVSFSAGSVNLAGNLATTGSGSFSQASGGTLLMSGSGTTITGTDIAVDNLTVTGTVSTAASVILTGNISVSGSFTASTGVITMAGTSKTISGAGAMSFGILSISGSVTSTANFSISSGLTVNGSLSASSGTTTFTGTSTLSGTANLFNATVNGTSLQLSATSILGIAGTMTITTGTLDVTSSAPNTVDFNGSGPQNINAITYSNLTLSNGNTKTAIAGLTVNNNMTIAIGTTFIPGPFTHSIYANWSNSGSFTAGTSTVQFIGNQNSNISGATTFNVLTVNSTTAATGLILQNNVSTATLNMIQGTMVTGTNTLTITTTRTGNGIILGNIQRTHAFTTGVAYAFEGPDNTVNFSTVSSVTSVTVSIVKGSVNDFPFGGSINRAYSITVPSGSYNATLRLHYEDNELNGSVESSMGLWNYNGSVWVSSGKTANSTTSNYVEQSGLTNITNRWTCSDNSNVAQWNGSVSSNWNTAANWTVLQGSASAPPSVTDIVNLGTIAFTNQPTISSAVNVKNINFGSTQAVILSMASGGSLSTGDIKGTWASSIIHTINANDQSITVNGDLSLSDGVTGHAINLNIGTGTVNAAGAFSQSGGANVVFNSAGTLSIFKNFNYTSGTFTAGSGTVIYNGIDNQNVGQVNYNHLSINKAGGAAEINYAIHIAGNLLISTGELDNSSTTNIAGNVTISSGATLHNNSILHIGGNWTNSGTFNDDGANVIFDGIGPQTITASIFNNLEINKPIGALAELTGDVTLKGNLAGTSGTLDIKSFFFNRTTIGGSAIIASAGTLIIAADNAPNKFSNYSLGPASTVIFNGTGTQHLLLPGLVYGNLIFRNSGLKILYTPVTVNGDLTIEAATTFDGGANTLTLNGHWVNNGTFTPSTSTVLCAGVSKNITGNTTFNKMTVTGSYTILNNVTFNGLLNITSTGSLNGGSTISTTLHGDLVNSGVLYTLGTTTFSGNVLQTLSLINSVTTVAITVNFNGSVSPVLNSTSTPQFGFLNINNTGGVNPSVGWTVLYALTVGSGASFNGGMSTHNILGGLINNGTMTSNGTFNFIPSVAATVNMGTAFSSNGTVIFGGTGALTLAGTPGSIRHVVISNTNAVGITPSSTWNITNNLTVNAGSILNAGAYTHTIGGNLSSSGTINSGTSTFTLNGTGAQNIYVLSAFNNLTVNKASGLSTLSADAAVNGILNFISGALQTGSYKLIQPASGSIAGAAQNTGWVNGKLQKNIAVGTTGKSFEIGDGASYTPVSLVFSGVTTAGDLTVFTNPVDQPNISSSTINAAESVNRFWTLANSGIVFVSCSAIFNYLASDLDAGANTNAFVVGAYNGGLWTYPMIGTVSPTSVQVTGLTTFVDFQIGEMTIYIKTWDGGAGTSNWGDAANWNTDGVPTATDNVELTGANIIDINVAATTKNLLLNNTGLRLSINSTKSLSVSGDLTLTSGIFNTAAAFATVSGTVDVSGGTVGFTGTAAQTIPAYNYNNLTSSSTGSRTLANSGTIGISGTFTPGTNTYIVAGSTIDFNEDGAQVIAAASYNHLTLSNTGVKTFSPGIIGIAGILRVAGTAIPNATVNLATISYNGSTDQIITTIPYYNLDVASSGGVVTILDAAVGNNLSITSGTVNIGTNATVQKIIAGGAVTIAGGSTFNVAGTSDATHLLAVGGNFTNNGTMNLRPDANSLCNTTFNKNGVQILSGSGPVTNFNNITINMGALSSNYLDVTATNFSAPNGFLILNNGSFNLNSSGTNITPFITDIATDNFLIPATAGLWVNAGTSNAVNMNWTVAGLVKVTGGVLNMGSVADNLVIPQNSGHLIVSAGNLNLTSAISNPGTSWMLDVQGGTMTINTLGSTTAGIAPFNMDVSGSTFNMSGGAIILQNAGGSSGQNLGYANLSTTGTGFTGGSLQIGNVSTSAAQTMQIVSAKPVYNLQINSANATALLQADLSVSNNVTVTAGTLDINGQTLKIGGDISSSGTFTVNSGKIEMNGTLAQTIPAGVFTGNQIKDLTIANSSGVTLAGTLNLGGILLVSTGTLSTGGYLTLLSSAAQTALIDGTGIGNVSGNVTMQRYLAAGYGYKYFSSPVQSATVNSFASIVDLNATFPNFYTYIENQASSGFTPYTTVTNPLVPMHGYAADFGASTAPKTVSITGAVNNGAISSTIYNHNQPYSEGFNLVGNPYPSPIDWNAASGWTKTNIDNAVYFFNSGNTSQYTGTYSTYINGVSSDGIAGNIIASMQGFFVHVSNGSFPVSGTFGVDNNIRVNNLSPVFHKSTLSTVPKQNTRRPRILLRLSANFSDHEHSSDPLIIYTSDQASPVFDKNLDAIKLMNLDDQIPNLYSLAADASKLVINALLDLDTLTVIPLGLQTSRNGTITFNLRNTEQWPNALHIYLVDAVTGAVQDLLLNPKFTIGLNQGTYTDRFSLRFNKVNAPLEKKDEYSLYGSGGALYVHIKLIDEQKGYLLISNLIGQRISRQPINGNGDYELHGLSPDIVYVVSFMTPKGRHSKKILIGGSK
ncbi:fibronectin type III domain-containing protein [Pedobacter sp. R-06]|uniref:fibronectin type III domain-containing protein n=1 Tax=Pedobacter sp. R-06 TaxID=3404051 RepID=UPI003CEDBCC7